MNIAGFRLGCCSMLKAFFAGSGGNLREMGRGTGVEDTEVPTQDIQDVGQEASRLRRELENLQPGSVIDVENAKVACGKMIIVDIPRELTEASARTRKDMTLD